MQKGGRSLPRTDIRNGTLSLHDAHILVERGVFIPLEWDMFLPVVSYAIL